MAIEYTGYIDKDKTSYLSWLFKSSRSSFKVAMDNPLQTRDKIMGSVVSNIATFKLLQ